MGEFKRRRVWTLATLDVGMIGGVRLLLWASLDVGEFRRVCLDVGEFFLLIM